MTKEKSYSENKFHISRVLCEIRNLYIDILYGAPLIGTIKSSKPGHTYVSNTDYSVVRWTSDLIANSTRKKTCVVDIGCGKGRALNGFHHYLTETRETKVIGLEYEEEVAIEAQKRCKNHPSITIESGDATEKLPDLTDDFDNYIYLFNPFSDEKILFAFIEKFLEQYSKLKSYPTIVYYCPRKLQIFNEFDNFVVEEKINQRLVPWKVDDIYRKVAFIRVK